MKHEVRWNCLTGLVLGWMLSAAAVGCLVTGFGMETDSFLRLMLVCIVAAAWGSTCFAFRWGDVLTACVIALAAGYFWHAEVFWEQLAALLRCVSQRYHMAYGWGVISLGGYGGEGPADLALGVIGCLAALSVSWVVVRKKSVLYALPTTILPLAACLVVTDTVPSALWLYLLMVGVVLLLLTDYSRRKGTRQSAWLTAYLALPVAAALGLLFLLAPRKNYVNHAARYEEQLIAWAEQFMDIAEEGAEELAGSLSGQPQAEVDLSTVGPRGQWNYTVMEVTASVDGTVYLRGQDYDTYSGTGWTASGGRSETFGGGSTAGTMTIRTRAAEEIQYLPYYPAEAVTLTGGRADSGNMREYTFSLAGEAACGIGEETDWLALPEGTESWASRLASRILRDKDLSISDAQAIADYVRSSASYDLNTPRMPEDETDFARWFLEESDTGYCVHFATSTVVLLRAAGIPARYVTGYAATCRAGQTVEVPEKAAHAWAEYYDAARNAWVVLESTPADLTNEVPETTEETAAAVTEGQPQTAPQTEQPRDTTVSSETQALPEVEEEPARKQEMPGWLKTALGSVFWSVLVLCVLMGQSLLRRTWKRNRWNRGAPNERALERWHQACILARLLGTKPPKELEALAQKARFSQHTLTDRELAAFGIWQQQASAQLRKKGLLRRLYYGIVFAVW